MSFKLTKILKAIQKRLNQHIHLRFILEGEKAKFRLQNELLNLRLDTLQLIDNQTSITCIIFSKDRTLQLHGLLKSLHHFCQDIFPVYILYTASSEEHYKAYKQLKDELSENRISFIREQNFAKDLRTLVQSIHTEKLFFLTDDGIFTNYFSMSELAKFNPYAVIPSLTKGIDLTYCFNCQKEQKLPEFKEIPEYKNLLWWKWEENKESPDWSWPLSVDGHIFSKNEIEIIFNIIEFKAPNSLEGKLKKHFNQTFLPRYGVCFNNPVFVNIPCNLVQNECNNYSTNHHSTEDLLNLWKNGFEIDFIAYHNLTTTKIKFSKLLFKAKESVIQ